MIKWLLVLLVCACQTAPPITEIQSDNLRELVLNLIYEAKDSVVLVVYSLKDPKILKALNQKAEAGVKVRVIVDRQASPLSFRHVSPKIELIKREGKGLMHMKIIVIDGHKVLTGSANMTHDSLKRHSNLIQIFDSKEMADYFLLKIKGMGPGFQPRLQPKTFGDVEVHFLPDDKSASLRIKQLMRSAEKTIKVAMYTFTRIDFAETLVRARNRGVDVQVIMDRSQLEGSNRKVYDYLQENGIQPLLNTNDALLHHKFMWIDGKVLVQGSANWTKAAFHVNDDYFIVQLSLTKTQENDMEHLWQNLLILTRPH